MILTSHVCTLLTAPKGAVNGAKEIRVSCTTDVALVFTLALAEPGAFRGNGPHHAHLMIMPFLPLERHALLRQPRLSRFTRIAKIPRPFAQGVDRVWRQGER